MITDFTRGATVTVYEDPFTRQRPEGQAKLLSLLSDDGETQRWRVRFEGEDRNVDRTLAVSP